MRKDHEGHDWIEIEEREKEALVQNVTEVRKNLEAKVEMISKATGDVAEKTDLCVKELTKIEKQVVKMKEEAERQRKEATEQAKNELSAMKANIEDLRSIQDDIADYAADYNTIRQHRETVQQIIDNNQANLTGRRCYQFPVLKFQDEWQDEWQEHLN